MESATVCDSDKSSTSTSAAAGPPSSCSPSLEPFFRLCERGFLAIAVLLDVGWMSLIVGLVVECEVSRFDHEGWSFVGFYVRGFLRRNAVHDVTLGEPLVANASAFCYDNGASCCR